MFQHSSDFQAQRGRDSVIKAATTETGQLVQQLWFIPEDQLNHKETTKTIFSEK